jgi:hypothetical protein
MGYVAIPKKHFLVERNGWNWKIYSIADGGKVTQGQPGCRFFL